MLPFKKRSAWEREWELLNRHETRFLQKRADEKESFLQKKLEKAVPEKLQSTLDLGFYKAFQTIFEKGTPYIEKTFNRKKKDYNYKLNSYAADLKESKKNIKAFSKESGASKTRNLIVSGIEGVGLGILGIGIPDIPLFTAMLIKSIHEIGASYGFQCGQEREQRFILKLITTSLSWGGKLEEGNRAINGYLEKGEPFPETREELLKQASGALSERLLYMKFLQGIPVAGVVGGAWDAIYMKQISDYADLKYKRRFLFDKINR